MDKAGELYWTEFWREKKLPPPIRVKDRTPRAWFYQEFHHLWQRHLPSAADEDIKLLEIGCAQSRWLPYFAREWGYAVAGLDYSELGCVQSRALLAREGVTGEVYHQDLFRPTPQQLEGFHLIFSNGVVEHFEDTALVLRQIAAYVRPGGLVVTIIPNLAGWLGKFQAFVSPEVMATHRPLNRGELAAAHDAAGLRLRFCNYLSFLHFSVVNPGDRWRGWRQACFFKGLKGSSVLAGVLRRVCPALPVNRRTAGYIVCIAEKPQERQTHILNNQPKEREKPITSIT